MRSRSARVLALAATVLTLLAPVARGDGDPASDVLLGQNVFYPYTPEASRSLMSNLNAATAAAAKAHFPLKVALIRSRVDLGIIPQLLGQPQRYANYLDVEISFQGRQPLLVVMKDGYGIDGLSPATTAAAAKLTPPAGGTSDDLAQAALTAVDKLAAADGHPISSVPAGGGSGGGGGNTTLLIVLIVAAISTASALLVVRRRQTT